MASWLVAKKRRPMTNSQRLEFTGNVVSFQDRKGKGRPIVTTDYADLPLYPNMRTFLEDHKNTLDFVTEHLHRQASELSARIEISSNLEENRKKNDSDANLVSLRRVLLLSGAVNIAIGVGAATGNAFAPADLMHPLIVTLFFLAGLTLVGMSRAAFETD
jgi:hypothetical protein